MTWLSNGIALRKAAQVLGASSSSRRAWKMKSPAWMINWLIDWSRDRWGLEDIHCSPGHPRQGRFQPAPDACGTARVIGSECRLHALAKHSDRCNRLRCGFLGHPTVCHTGYWTVDGHADPGSAVTDGIGNVGIDTLGMGEPDLPLAARGGRGRMDRKLVLFHSSGPEPQTARRPARWRAWRGLAGPWRRLLSDHEISGGSGQHAG